MTALLLDLNGVLFEDRTPFPGGVEVVASTDLPPQDCLMVGDDVVADVALTTAPGVCFSAP